MIFSFWGVEITPLKKIHYYEEALNHNNNEQVGVVIKR